MQSQSRQVADSLPPGAGAPRQGLHVARERMPGPLARPPEVLSEDKTLPGCVMTSALTDEAPACRLLSRVACVLAWGVHSAPRELASGSPSVRVHLAPEQPAHRGGRGPSRAGWAQVADWSGFPGPPPASWGPFRAQRAPPSLVETCPVLQSMSPF